MKSGRPSTKKRRNTSSFTAPLAGSMSVSVAAKVNAFGLKTKAAERRRQSVSWREEGQPLHPLDLNPHDIELVLATYSPAYTPSQVAGLLLKRFLSNQKYCINEPEHRDDQLSTLSHSLFRGTSRLSNWSGFEKNNVAGPSDHSPRRSCRELEPLLLKCPAPRCRCRHGRRRLRRHRRQVAEVSTALEDSELK